MHVVTAVRDQEPQTQRVRKRAKRHRSCATHASQLPLQPANATR